MIKHRWLLFLFIFLGAALLRLIALPGVPPGLQHDEVFHGHDAVTVLLGYRPLYFTSNAGNEPLFIYWMSLTVGLFGHNAWGIRLAAVICGLLTLLFTTLWIRRAYNDRTALIASALLAVSFWPIFLSRVGLRAASVPMMSALAAWLLFEGMARTQNSADRSEKRRVWIWFVAAGAALGLALYTYPAARTLPIVFFLFWILTSLLSRRINRPLLITLLTALIVLAPLAYTIATLPEADVRLQQLGAPVQEALKGNFEPVLRYTVATAGMFNLAGDPIARYNLPGRPVFDAITGLLFLLGILIALRQWREPRNLFALLWLPIGLLPSMLSDSAPSFLRASASLPVVFLFPALAVDWLLSHRAAAPSGPLLRRHGQAQRIFNLIVAGWIVVVALFTVRDYFFAWPARSDVREVYRSDLASAAKWI
jgi:4-amino-4-deoxy-L-arabinose transferase-like glycosyltransferase